MQNKICIKNNGWDKYSMKRKSIESKLLDELERIDSKKDKGKITQRDHDVLSKKAVRSALSKVIKK